MRTLQEEFSHIEIGRSSEFRNLTLFPLTRQSEPVPEMDYLLLEDGIAQGKVRVTELHAGGSVPELRLENNADLPVLLVDGEELVGAKQNRVLNLTILAPANHTKGYDSRLAATDSSRMDVVQIAGVAADSRQIASRHVHDLYDPASPEIFVPLLQHPEDGRDLALLLKTSIEPGTLAEAVRAQVLGLNPDQPVYDTRTLQKIADVALGPARLCLLLLAIFAGTALLTACVGLFAIVSYTVTQRTRSASAWH